MLNSSVHKQSLASVSLEMDPIVCPILPLLLPHTSPTLLLNVPYIIYTATHLSNAVPHFSNCPTLPPTFQPHYPIFQQQCPTLPPTAHTLQLYCPTLPHTAPHFDYYAPYCPYTSTALLHIAYTLPHTANTLQIHCSIIQLHCNTLPALQHTACTDRGSLLTAGWVEVNRRRPPPSE